MRKVTYFIILVVLQSSGACAIEDSLQKAVEIALHGNRVQSERLKIVAENVANENSISTKPGGDPYRRKVVFAQNYYDKRAKANLVRVKKIDTDKSSFSKKYDPGNPAADLEGFVKYPNVQLAIERADASEAQRSYEANLNVIQISRSMMQKTIEAMK